MNINGLIKQVEMDIQEHFKQYEKNENPATNWYWIGKMTYAESLMPLLKSLKNQTKRAK